MNIKHLVIGLLAAIILSSCSTSKNKAVLPYFTDVKDMQVISENTGDYSPKIQPDDELYILITSEAPGATAAYNLPLTNPATRDLLGAATTPQIQTYLVNSKGEIQLPIIGKIHVAGLTTEEIAEFIAEKISGEVKDPIIYVRLMNFSVSVAGEVRQPGTQRITTERYSVLDAISGAGDMTEYGERDNVLVIREENGKRVAHRLNLNSAEAFQSPYFYLQPNDYVYITPNQIREGNSKYSTNNAYKVSVVSTIVSGVSVIASLVIALTVK